MAHSNTPSPDIIVAKAFALIRRAGEILVCMGYDPKLEEHFGRLPGGKIEFGETGAQAVRREIREEFGVEVSEPSLLGWVENIFEYGGAPGHEVVALYEVRPLAPEWLRQDHPALLDKDEDWIETAWIAPEEADVQELPIYPASARVMIDQALAKPASGTRFFPQDILVSAETVLAQARSKKLKLATAESCTGGLIAGALTEIAGSSDVFDRGFVTYSNEAKAMTLKVDPAILRAHGSVSSETAMGMVQGALAFSRADIAVAVTGVAGPGGGSVDKPVGLVHFASARKGGDAHPIERRFGDLGRTQVRLDTVRQALDMLREEIGRA